MRRLVLGILFLSYIEPSTAARVNKRIVDIHGHIACINQSKTDCYINPRLQKNIRFHFYLQAFGVNRRDVKKGIADKKMVDHLVSLVHSSQRLSKIVVLAMDGVINEDGKLDYHKSEIYISNSYIYKVSKAHPELLFGASINPYRKDALERLDEAYNKGAVLIKWLPNIMQIDPSDQRLISFYQRLIQYDLPLLTHTGFEHSFSSANDRLGDPALLELPLSMGVKVVAAHFGTGGENENEDNFERILPMFKKYPNLYGDLSGLSALSKVGALKTILAHPSLKERMLYGSDYPLNTFPVSTPAYQLRYLKPRQLFKLYRIKNKFDRDIVMKEMFGVPRSAMERTFEFLKLD